MEQILDMLLNGDHWWPVLVRIAVVIGLTYLVARVYQIISKRTVKTNKIHVKFMHNIMIALIYLIGFFIALSQLKGFDKTVEGILGASGIAALTVGLAAQESLGNAVSGLFISMFRPFEVGDRVRLINGNITGYIEDITLRHTVIRTFMNSRVIVPNSTINKDMVENSNYLDGKASGFIDVTIAYQSDMELAKSIMAKIIEDHPDFVDNREPGNQSGPKVVVYVRSLGLFGVELRASMWTKDVNNNFNACSEVRERVKTEFDNAGIAFAHCTPTATTMPE